MGRLVALAICRVHISSPCGVMVSVVQEEMPLSGIPISGALEHQYISLAGMIGAGKTTLAEALAKHLGVPVYYEPVKENKYLVDFYNDVKRYSFPLQVYLLNARFQQQQSIVWSGKGGVQDRTIYEDAVFAKMLMRLGLMEERDYETYNSLFSNMSSFMRRPNMIVFLDVTPEVSYQRIQQRKRECEAGVTLEYLAHLHAAYKDFITDISKAIPVVRVEWNSFTAPEEVARKIGEAYASVNSIVDVKG